MSVANTIQELATDIGNAYDEVQTKGGTLPQNKNTNNLATAIATIPTGITPTGTIAITQNGTYDVTDKASAAVNVPNMLVQCMNCELASVHLDNEINMYLNAVLRNQTNLVSIVLPNAYNTVGQSYFSNNPTLSLVDLGKNVKGFNNLVFVNDVALTTLILRKNSAISSLYGITTFTNTPFRNGTGGTVYVPQALLSQYQNATNWSALESTTFLPIEGSIYE